MPAARPSRRIFQLETRGTNPEGHRVVRAQLYEAFWSDGGESCVIRLPVHANLVDRDSKSIQQSGAQDVVVGDTAAPRREPGLGVVGVLSVIAACETRQRARRLLIPMLVVEASGESAAGRQDLVGMDAEISSVVDQRRRDAVVF